MFPRRFSFMSVICLMLSLMFSVPAFAKGNGHGGHSAGKGKSSFSKSFGKGKSKSTKSKSKGFFGKRPGAKPGSRSN